MFQFFKRRKIPSAVPWHIQGYVVSHVGKVRGNNEDNYCLGAEMNRSSADHSESSLSLSDSWQLAAVFDGMGGGEIGELASLTAAEIFREAGESLGSASKTQVDQVMRQAYQTANNRVNDLRQFYRVYGTTGTAVCTDGRELKVYHLGDSRCCLLRAGELFRLTVDQTLAQMRLEAGTYSQEDPEVQADKHKLTEYIGRDRTREHLKPTEGGWIPLHRGDRVLLCSDGLYDMCDEEQIRTLLSQQGDSRTLAAALTDAALENGGRDNITCLVLVFN